MTPSHCPRPSSQPLPPPWQGCVLLFGICASVEAGECSKTRFPSSKKPPPPAPRAAPSTQLPAGPQQAPAPSRASPRPCRGPEPGPPPTSSPGVALCAFRSLPLAFSLPSRAQSLFLPQGLHLCCSPARNALPSGPFTLAHPLSSEQHQCQKIPAFHSLNWQTTHLLIFQLEHQSGCI